MGTPTVREFKPTPHQLFTAEQLIRQCHEVFEISGVSTLIFKEAALTTGHKFCEEGYFKWDSKQTGERMWYGIKWETRYFLRFYIKEQGYEIGLFDVECQKFFIYGSLIGLWHQDKLMWELVERYKRDEET